MAGAGHRATPATEAANPRAAQLDRLSTLGVVRVLQREDATVAGAVRRCAPAIARAVDAILPRFQSGGRLIHVGAGTSGRMGALDAAEIPPTFGIAPRRVLALVAGGRRALTRSAEGAEDDRAAARRDIARLRLTPADSVVGIAASGRTPYTIAAVRAARRRGALTIALACVSGSELAAAAEFAIEPVTGAEAIAGSTRLKAGSAQKMVLHQISSTLMVRLGRVRGNLMFHVQPTNAKLRDRAARILVTAARWPAPGESAPSALRRARQLLRRSGGDLTRALALARPTRHA